MPAPGAAATFAAMSAPLDRWLLDDPKPVQSLKKALAAPDGVRAFRVQNKGPALPDALRSLRNLEILVLRGTELTHFPAWLPELTHLRALDLGGCDPSLFTRAELARLAELPQLEEIVAFGIAPRSFDAFAELTRLRRLRIHNSRLAAIPDAWRALRSLAELDLAYNALTALPDLLRDLPLVSLRLGQNQLRRLPAWLLASPTLVRIDLDFNKLTDVPLPAGPSALARLDLAFNPIPPARIEALRAALPACTIEFRPAVPTLEDTDEDLVDSDTIDDASDIPAVTCSVRGLPPASPAAPRPALDLRAIHQLQPSTLAVPDGSVVAPPAWSPDGRWLALAQAQRVLVTDAAALRPDVPPTFATVAETDGEITTIGFTRDHLIVLHSDGSVHALDLARRTVAWRTAPEHAGGEWFHLATHPAVPWLLTARDGSIHELRALDERGELLATIPSDDPIRRFTVQPDGLVVIERYGKPPTVVRLGPPVQPVADAPGDDLGAALPAADRLAGNDTFDLELTDRSGTPLARRRHLQAVHHEQLQQLAFSPDGAWLASAAVDGTIALWRARDLEPLRVLGGIAPAIERFAFDPRGALLAAHDEARELHVWLPQPEPTVPAPTALLGRLAAPDVPELASIKLSCGLAIAPPARLRDAERLRIQPPPGEYRLFAAAADGLPAALLLTRGTPAELDRVTDWIAAVRRDGRPAVTLAERRVALLDEALAHECRIESSSHRDAVAAQWDELGWVHYPFKLRVSAVWEDILDQSQILGLRLDLPDGPRPAFWGISADGVPQCLVIDLATLAASP